MDSVVKQNLSPSISEKISNIFAHSFYIQLLLIVLLSICLELMRAAGFHGFARAESCFAEGAREMLANKQYIAPLFYGVPYFDKPPFHYWLIIFAYKIFGATLLNARAISTLAGAFTIAATAIFIKRIFGNSTALLTAIILATSVGFFEFGAVAMPDMLLCLFENIAVFFAYTLLYTETKQRWLWLLIMSASFAFGWLTKGPAALIIPGIAIAITLIISKPVRHFSFKELVLSAIIFIVLLAPWHWLVYKNYGLSAFNWLYIQGNIGRFIGQHNAYNFGHGHAYMLTNLLTNFLPWTIFLIPALYQLISPIISKKTFSLSNKFLLLMLIWSVVNTLFFSISSSNWGYYNLPIFPALSIITAQFLISLGSKYPPRTIQTICLTIAIGFFVAMSVYALILLPIKTKRDSYLGFAEKIKQLPNELPCYIHLDLVEQSLLTDYAGFASNRTPLYSDQANLEKMILSHQPFIVLIAKRQFENLQSISKTNLAIVETEPYRWLNFPGCKLINESPPNTPITIILAVYNPR